jgi:hypothetical protein
MKPQQSLSRSFVLVVLMAALSIQCAFGWGKDGHKIINRVAMETLPANMPAFLRTAQALDEVEYLAPEPDRWRSSADPELNQTRAPDHFIDLELADLAAPNGLPLLRYDFVNDLYRAQKKYPGLAEKLTPQRVGLLPWQANEDLERLRVDMREYRVRLMAHQPTYGAEQAILYDIGLLGHYVGDGSQPLHTTIDYNGWVEAENPEGFTRRHGIHSEFETQFVEDNLHVAEVRALVPASPRILDSPFQDFVSYLCATHGDVAEVYRMEKRGGFDGAGTAQSRTFTAERLAAGATMLRDIVVTSWIESAQVTDDLHGH